MKYFLPAAASCALLCAAPVQAQHGDHRPMDGMTMPAPPQAQGELPGMAMPMDDRRMTMSGALGANVTGREATGTSWQPVPALPQPRVIMCT